MNLPNKLTVFRIILIPFFLVVFLGQVFGSPASNLAAAAIFGIASITDWFDGYIARKYNLITNFGKFMDPMADKLLVCSALIAMIEKGCLPAWAVIIIVSREFLVSAFRLVAADNNVVIAAGNLGKAKTAATMLMILYILIGAWPVMVDFLIWVTVALTLLSAFEYVYKNREILEQIRR